MPSDMNSVLNGATAGRRITKTTALHKQQLESAQGKIAQPAAAGEGGMGRKGGKPQTDTWARTDKRTYLNGSKTPQVNAKWDSVQIISFWHSDRHKHTQGKNLYIFAMQAVKIMNAQ